MCNSFPCILILAGQIRDPHGSVILPEVVEPSAVGHPFHTDNATKDQSSTREGRRNAPIEMNSSLDSIPPVPSIDPLVIPQVNAIARPTSDDVPTREGSSEIDEEDLVEESLSLDEIAEGSEADPPPGSNEPSTSDVGDLDKARYIYPSEITGVAGGGGDALLGNENDEVSITKWPPPSHRSALGTPEYVEDQALFKGHASVKEASDKSTAGPGPSTPPTASQPLSACASPKKRARVWEGTPLIL